MSDLSRNKHAREYMVRATVESN